MVFETDRLVNELKSSEAKNKELKVQLDEKKQDIAQILKFTQGLFRIFALIC